MFIKDSVCVSPVATYPSGFPEKPLPVLKGNRFYAIEPHYTGLIPAGLLRRMGKAVRMGVGAGLQLLSRTDRVDGILIGTANGGLEDCIKFLNQIVDYKEGTLTPTNFVQSTPNAIAGQLALLTGNTGYNITHVHKGAAFENTLLDALLLLGQGNMHRLLVGGIEEISAYNYHIDSLAGLYKNEPVDSDQLLHSNSAGTVNGEGATLFMLESQPSLKTQVAILDVDHVTFPDFSQLQDKLIHLLQKQQLSLTAIDALVLGVNGDSRTDDWYREFRELFDPAVPAFSFKNISGEYPTASAFGVWLGSEILLGRRIPRELVLTHPPQKPVRTLLVYNHYKAVQHSFILLRLHETPSIAATH